MNVHRMRHVLRERGLTDKPVCPGCRTETRPGAMKQCPTCKQSVCPGCWDPYGKSCIECTPPEQRGEIARDGRPNVAEPEVTGP